MYCTTTKTTKRTNFNISKSLFVFRIATLSSICFPREFKLKSFANILRDKSIYLRYIKSLFYS